MHHGGCRYCLHNREEEGPGRVAQAQAEEAVSLTVHEAVTATFALRYLVIFSKASEPLNKETKNQPKEEVLGWTSLRTTGQKLRSDPPNPGKQAFRHGHSARTSTKKLRSEKLRADFSFPINLSSC